MGWVLFLLVVVAVVALLLKAKAGEGGDEDWPFYAKKPLTQPEQVLYFRICKALPDHIVLAQVQLSHILGVKKGHNFHAWNNRINRMSTDFVVCQKDAGVVAVIELDDATHEAAGRKAADRKKDKALQSAGIPVIRWQAKALPEETTIRAALGGPQRQT